MLLYADSEDSGCGFCHDVAQLLKIASFLNTGNKTKIHVM